MNRRLVLLISFIFISRFPLSAQINHNLIFTVSQGFRTFDADGYDPYRAPLGIGIGYQAGNLWKSLVLGIDFTWSGFSPEENEASFENSMMYSGLVSAGWMYSLLDDPNTSLTLGPIVGFGLYQRSIPYEGRNLSQIRSLFMAGVEFLLTTDNSMIFGTSLKINGFLDNEPVWGMALEIHIGYRFGAQV